MAQPMQIPAVKDLMVDDRVTPCPSHGAIVEQPTSWSNRILYLAALFLSSDVEPAPTLPHQPDLVLYLVFDHFLRDHENHCPDWLRRGYLVLYLADLFPPKALIIGMFLAPRLDLAVPTLEIVRIRRQPSLVTFLLAFRPARGIRAAFLDLPCPWIRFVKPPAVGALLLPALCCFHTLILTDEVAVELTGGGRE